MPINPTHAADLSVDYLSWINTELRKLVEQRIESGKNKKRREIVLGRLKEGLWAYLSWSASILGI